jgi:capsular exopolysaccharide synthesis family protein
MSRIHEALKKADEERHAGQVADAMTWSLGAARLGLMTESSAPAKTAETSERTAVVSPPASSAFLRFDALAAHCAHPEWHADPNSNVFSNLAGGACCAEQFRTLRSRLYQVRENRPTYTLLVTSSLPDEGKTFVSTNLARAIVHQPHRRALIIDADLRYPQLHLSLGAPLAPGLTEYLSGKKDEVAIIQRGDAENLCFIPGGTAATNPSELLCNGRIKTLLERLAPVFDWVILDTSPCLPVEDANVLANLCDGVLLVVRAGSTPVEVAQRVCQQLGGKNVVGVVLNRVEESDFCGSGYYGYGYGNSADA